MLNIFVARDFSVDNKTHTSGRDGSSIFGATSMNTAQNIYTEFFLSVSFVLVKIHVLIWSEAHALSTA